MSRGSPRSSSPSQPTFGSQVRSTSRGRDRASSNGRNRPSSRSRARSQAEDANYRWSIMTHDPYERFEPKDDKPFGAPIDEDDLSEEEHISDDEPSTDYDIAVVELPNSLASINDHYKKSSVAADGALANNLKKKLYIDPARTPQALRKKGVDTQRLAEALALEKAFEDAKEMNSEVPANMVDRIRHDLDELGYKQMAKTDDLVKLENAKEKNSQDYKAFVIRESKKPLHELNSTTKEKEIVRSVIGINETDFRASRTITLGKFFDEEKDPNNVRSFLVYVDNSTDAMMALQYTIGCLVKSGDVIYVVHTNDLNEPLDYYKNRVEHFTDNVETYMNELYDQDFQLHVIVESTYRKYTKHFLNQLLIYLEPVLFVVSHLTLVSGEKLSNYVPPCPFLVVKRKNHKKK